MFNFPRKSSAGCSIPSWLKPGPVLVKRHVRNKYDPLVDDAELLEITPSYGTVRLGNGRELNVSLRDLAPAPLDPTNPSSSDICNDNDQAIDATTEPAGNSELINNDMNIDLDSPVFSTSETNNVLPFATEFHGPGWVRRSERVSKPVQRYGT